MLNPPVLMRRDHSVTETSRVCSCDWVSLCPHVIFRAVLTLRHTFVAVQVRVAHYGLAVLDASLHCPSLSAVLDASLHYPSGRSYHAFPCTSLHYPALPLPCTSTLQYPALPCNILQYTISLHYPALQCNILHYPASPFTTRARHYSALHYPLCSSRYALHTVVWPFWTLLLVKLWLDRVVEDRPSGSGIDWLICERGGDTTYNVFVTKNVFSNATIAGALSACFLLTNLVCWPGVWALKQLPVLRDAL